MTNIKSTTCENISKCSEKSNNYIKSICEGECTYSCSDTAPLGITIIPGSGKFTEFPLSVDNLNNSDDATSFLDIIRNADICPRAYPPNNICIRDCTEFAAAAQINFINGNLIIGDPEPVISPLPPTSILQILPTPSNDILDIFPNLIGVNGSIYIVNTLYRRISGFERLRFVTGSIVIVNNANLIAIPTFPSLLSIGGLITSAPVTDVVATGRCPCTGLESIRCGRSALIISNNKILGKIYGFDAVRQIKDGIFIANNNCLSMISGFIYLYRTDRIIIKANPKLNKIIGFCNIDTVNINLVISENNTAGDHDFGISAFNLLETVGQFVFSNNSNIKTLKLDNLRTVLGYFIVRYNNNLEEIITSVRTISSLYVERNKSLKNILFAELEEVVYSLSISGNCSLVCLVGFPNLKRIGSGLLISENKQLIEIKTFEKIKYVGAECAEPILIINPNEPNCDNCETCVPGIIFNWDTITRLDDCIIIDPFNANTYDKIACECKYNLPLAFFKLICHTALGCGETDNNTDVPNLISYSIIIYGNQRLKAIGGFDNLKHVESNIYIINNILLNTIHAFEKLVYVLDVWIRNNPALKFILGFTNLLSVRDFKILESIGLIDLNSIKSLESAQTISIEAKSSKSVKYPKNPIPSVLGYTLYYCYDRRQ